MFTKVRVHAVQHAQVDVEQSVGNVYLEGNRNTTETSGISSVTSVIKVLQYSMTVFGMYHKQTCGDGVKNATVQTPCCKISSKLLLCYNLFIIFCLWANVLRVTCALFVGDFFDREIVPLGIIATLWSCMCSINATAMVKSSHPRTGQQFKICDHWKNNIFPKIEELDNTTDSRKLGKKLKMWLAAGWLCIVMNSMALAGAAFLPSLFGTSMDPIYSVPLPNHLSVRVITFILFVINTIAWVLPVLFVIAMSTVFNHSFRVCKIALYRTINESKGDKLSNEFYKLRRLHLDICKGIEIMDKVFGVLFANWFATNVPIACFVLYNIIKEEQTVFMTVTYLFWMASAIVSIVLTSGVAASLNQAAHSPLETIYDINTTGFTMDQMGQLQLFLSKLTGTSIGFTVINFVVITKELLLTIGGLFLTYFFVLIQF